DIGTGNYATSSPSGISANHLRQSRSNMVKRFSEDMSSGKTYATSAHNVISLGSQSEIGSGHEVGGGSGSGGGDDDHEGEDEDVNGDDDQGH
nr:hypothetical protein [Tanacetum cinerariifolium]